MSRTVPTEELLCQQSYAIKNQLGHPKPPTKGFGTHPSLVLYGIREPVIGPFRAWKLTILVLNGIRLLAPVSLGKLSTNESAVMSDLDQ